MLMDGPGPVKTAARLVGQLPPGLSPLPDLDTALPLYQGLGHFHGDDLRKHKKRPQEVIRIDPDITHTHTQAG